MQYKKISVALTTYNGSRYLEEQLNSIYNQTYPIYEVVVTDDCSNDSTAEILKEYSDKYGLRYSINKKNLGFIKNFEMTMLKCSGDYIALSDQDDVWLPQKIEILMNEIGNHSLICSDAKLIDSNGNVFENSFKKYQGIFIPKNEFVFQTLFFRNFVTGCTTVFKKSTLEKAFPFPEKIPHDWWIGLIASCEEGVKYLNVPLVLYRQHRNNTYGATKKSFRQSLKNRNIYMNLHLLFIRNAIDFFEKKQVILDSEKILFLYNLKKYRKSLYNRFLHIYASYFLFRELQKITPPTSFIKKILYVIFILFYRNKSKIKET